VGADSPLSDREVLGKFADIRADQKAIDDRVAKLASETVTTETWARENGHIQRDIAEVDAHCEERHKITMGALGEVKSAMRDLKTSSEQQIRDLKSSLEKKSDFTWQRVLAIASILAILAAAWYTALHQGGH
jgi:hypothetical protein